MRVLPVLDVKAGQVVRGIAGRRSEYTPIRSPLTASSEPLAVARAFRDRFGLTELYLADLDAIAGAAPALSLYRALTADGFALWIDAGVRQVQDAESLAELASLVVGLETVAGPTTVDQLSRRHADRVVFSLDLKSGRPLGDRGAWAGATPWQIAERVVAAGVRRLLVLDLTCVGVDRGTGTEELCARLAATHPAVEVLAGGGVRGTADLFRLRQLGVRGVLVASALHDGRLSPADLERLTDPT
jgi:phosphoribosylformimino-5-aminoimidazole carboxamide ribotide isomerase